MQSLLVEAATGDIQHPTHRGHPVLVAVAIDEPVLYSGSLAKYRGFFSMSRSSSVRRNWARSLRISLFGLDQIGRLLVTPVRLDRLHPLIKAVGRDPEPLRDLGYRIPRSTICRTTSSRNSGYIAGYSWTPSYAPIIASECPRHSGKSTWPRAPAGSRPRPSSISTAARAWSPAGRWPARSRGARP